MAKKGFKMTEEHKRKISESNKRTMRINGPRKGFKHSEETKKKMSLAHIGSKGSNWKGGKYIDHRGYVYINSPNHPSCRADNYVQEHRLVVEKHLGRYLKPTEIIHHINHNPSDNRIKNLTIMSTSKHSAMHWAGKKFRLGKYMHGNTKTKRQCYRCKKTKNINKFYKSKDKPLGRDHICKPCKSIYAKQLKLKKLKNIQQFDIPDSPNHLQQHKC